MNAKGKPEVLSYNLWLRDNLICGLVTLRSHISKHTVTLQTLILEFVFLSLQHLFSEFLKKEHCLISYNFYLRYMIRKFK